MDKHTAREKIVFLNKKHPLFSTINFILIVFIRFSEQHTIVPSRNGSLFDSSVHINNIRNSPVECINI